MYKSIQSVILSVFFLTVLSIPGFAAEPDELNAIRAAQNFLEILDQSDFSVAWNRTSMVNQSYTNHPEWFRKILAVRPHLGQVLDRSMEKISLHDGWVGLPDGQYLRVSFKTVFLNKADSLETVVVVKEQGRWLVSSYHLR
ncbi:MAG: DUF4019 domain-containing protein [Desulfuromonadales bacterium]|nr:DUF4019 domain-containing protein [Desulfuromonadales bacterium]MBN2790932.1 DUF4019 domain-containing protein [Desulfuromonadales bacterium]